jgi:hypothetical protein
MPCFVVLSIDVRFWMPSIIASYSLTWSWQFRTLEVCAFACLSFMNEEKVQFDLSFDSFVEREKPA